jgi:peroxiredoxin
MKNIFKQWRFTPPGRAAAGVLSRTIIVTAALLLCAVFAWAEPPSKNVSDAFTRAGLKLEQDLKGAPAFQAPLAASAKNASPAEYKGKVLIINFWTTWCEPCRTNMPALDKLYQKLKAKGLEVLAVNIQEQKANVDGFMKKNKLSFPAALDGDGKISGQYGVKSAPASCVLDRQGRLLLRVNDAAAWDKPEVAAAFETLLAEKN